MFSSVPHPLLPVALSPVIHIPHSSLQEPLGCPPGSPSPRCFPLKTVARLILLNDSFQPHSLSTDGPFPCWAFGELLTGPFLALRPISCIPLTRYSLVTVLQTFGPAAVSQPFLPPPATTVPTPSVYPNSSHPLRPNSNNPSFVKPQLGRITHLWACPSNS